MSQHISLVAPYANHHLAESTARKLHEAGFDSHQLSIVGGGVHGLRDLDGVPVLDNLDALDATQAACIPPDRIHAYEENLQANMMLLVAHGTPDEIEQAKEIIDSNYPDIWGYATYYGCSD